MGFVVAPVYQFILAEVPIKDAGSASGVINAIGQIGGAIGIAVIGDDLLRADRQRRGDERGERPPRARPGHGGNRRSEEVDPEGDRQFRDVLYRSRQRQGPDRHPDSCQRGEDALKRNEESDPDSIAAIRASLTQRGKEANQRNFTEAVEHTLIWEIAALGVIFALTFLLPPRPRSKAELARIAAETGIPM